MKFQDNIKKLKRIQTSQNRDLLSGINLDRNEKVDLFDLRIQSIPATLNAENDF